MGGGGRAGGEGGGEDRLVIQLWDGVPWFRVMISLT